ncbi:MAG: hypothetical protein BroJett011_77680 [Chloroflexota bacterium]|nr:MAG: hypothetical protein BroJett011_77680 [Chloroflexota bacterium]
MKRHWRIRRQTNPKLDGQQRWDRAYQLLLQWSEPLSVNIPLPSHTNPNPTQEVVDDDASRCLCQGIDPEPGASPNY